MTDTPARIVMRLTARAESAEARVAELERHYAAAGPEHNLLALLDLYHERAESAEARVKELEAHVEFIKTRTKRGQRITSLESELAEARLDLERWHTSVEAHRLATILEQRDEARAEVKALESEVARLREEAGLEALVRESLDRRLIGLSFVQLFSGGWRAEWEGHGSKKVRRPVKKAHAATLPALLRAILEVEKGGSGG